MDRPMRYAFIVVVAFVLVIGQATRIVALQTGAISGSVTDANTNAPIASAKISATAPTGSYTATSGTNGFYSIVGVPPDTYVVTVSKSGYQTSVDSGITVTQGINVRVDVHLLAELKTLGRIPVKATRQTLLQPDTVTDAYNVDTHQAEALKGTPLASEQFGLLTQLPGVSNAGGYPILRGGLENNEGYQIEGISVVDPFFNQFANNDTFNGAQSIKVVLGPGDATQGGAGSGYINSVVKRGTYPAFGIVQTEFGILTRQNNLNFEYGGATPDNRFSWFLSGRYQPNMAQGGAQGSNGGGPYKPDQVVDGIHLNDQLGALKYTVAADSLINLFYTFGDHNANQLQVFDEKGIQNYVGNYGIVTFLTPYYAYDPIYQFINQAFFGVNFGPSQLPVDIGQNPNQTFPNVPGQVQEYELTKVALSHQFNSTTFLNTRIYRLNGNTNFNLTEANYPYLSFGFPSLFNDIYEGTPFQTTGAAFDLQKQAGDKNFISMGAEYKFSQGHLLVGLLGSLALLFEPNEIGDFVVGGGGQFDPAKIGGTVRLPLPEFGTLDPEYTSDAYITDQIKPTSRLTLQPGLRYDAQRIHEPAGLYDVHALQPKFGITYALGPAQDTVLRASYGHSTVFGPLGQVETIYLAPAFFHNFPATASNCGGFNVNPPFSGPCKDYYDQIVNDFEANIGINPSTFPGPQQSDSYDFSIEHEFPRVVSVKLTSWYRRDYDVIVNEALPILVGGTLVNGPQTVTNNGSGHAFGADLGIFRQLNPGLSGQLNFTYINQFINYLSGNAFVPTVLPSTLATVVHPPYLSPFNAALALDYRRNGWRVSPDLIYSRGTPTGFPQNYYVKINGVYEAVPNTNYFGNPSDPCFFVDPQVPGTPAAPNIVGSYGGGCDKARNGVLGKASIFGNFTISKDITAHSTVGLSIFNLFDQRVVGLYSNTAGGTGAYVNNGFGAYGAGSGFSQYGPQGFGIPGAPAAFPPGPFFNTESGSGRSGLLFFNVRI